MRRNLEAVGTKYNKDKVISKNKLVQTLKDLKRSNIITYLNNIYPKKKKSLKSFLRELTL